MSNQQPSIGRVVHYVAYGTPGGEHKPAHRAAIITEVSTDPVGPVAVSLAVINPTGVFFNQYAPYDGSPEPKGGTWHWPEFVPPTPAGTAPAARG